MKWNKHKKKLKINIVENKADFNLLILQLLNFLWISLMFVSFKLLPYHIDKKLRVMLLPR